MKRTDVFSDIDWGCVGVLSPQSEKERTQQKVVTPGEHVQSLSMALFDTRSDRLAGSPRMSFISRFPAIFGVSRGLALRMRPCSG